MTDASFPALSATELQVRLRRAGPAGSWLVVVEHDGHAEPLPGLAALVSLLERLDRQGLRVTPVRGLR